MVLLAGGQAVAGTRLGPATTLGVITPAGVGVLVVMVALEMKGEML